MKRLFFSIKSFLQHRISLKKYLMDLSLQTQTIFNCNLIQIKKTGIKILVLDHDGVLAGHDVDELDIKTKTWLDRCVHTFGEGRVFILSNRPTLNRQNYYKENFPGVRFVWVAKKKPYPDGLLEILKQTKANPQEVLIMDDRLLTGVLAAILVGVKALWVTEPRIEWNKNPIQELFFIILRKIERLLAKIMVK